MSERRRLYLLRHVKSSWDQPGQPDHERPLADRGREALELLLRHVQIHRIQPELVLCSSARRARETLSGVLPVPLALIEDELYLAGHEQLLARLRRVEPEVRSVLVVGHNPALQMLTLSLAAGERGGRPPGTEGLEEIRRKLPTGALVTLRFDSAWSALAPGTAELVDYVRPKALLHQKQI